MYHCLNIQRGVPCHAGVRCGPRGMFVVSAYAEEPTRVTECQGDHSIIPRYPGLVVDEDVYPVPSSLICVVVGQLSLGNLTKNNIFFFYLI